MTIREKKERGKKKVRRRRRGVSKAIDLFTTTKVLAVVETPCV